MIPTQMRLEDGSWKLGEDGLPINPKADPNCTICDGKGIIEDEKLSLFSSVLIDCRCIRRTFNCKDCGFDTLNNHEYYMIHNELWEQIGGGKDLLCIGCVEQRLGRLLTKEDFPPLPVNELNSKAPDIRPETLIKSERLKARLTCSTTS